MTNAIDGIRMSTIGPTWKHRVFPDVDEATLVRAFLENRKEIIAEEIRKAKEAKGKVIVEIKFGKGRY